MNRRIQGTIVTRAITYYLVFSITAVCLLVAWRSAVQGVNGGLAGHLKAIWFQLGPVSIAIVLLLPVILLDSLNLSHRMTGPMVRMREAMRAAAKGQPVQPLRLRSQDYWHEFADDFNKLMSQLQLLQRAPLQKLDPQSDRAFTSALESVLEASKEIAQASGDEEEAQDAQETEAATK